MRAYFISPKGIPENQVLFPNIRPYFESNDIIINKEIFHSDILVIDLHSRIADYYEQEISWLLFSRIPIITICEWDRGLMSSDEWPHPLTNQQKKIFEHIQRHNIKAVHFCRLLDKTKRYPENLFPYEKPILYEEPLLTPEQLFDRPNDICFIANHSPNREAIAKAICMDGRLKCDVSIGSPKIPFEDFLWHHKRAKLFISSGAGGFTDERKQLLFSAAGLIQERTDQLLLHPFTHLENCLMINSEPTKEDLDTIFDIVNDKERLYGIYKNGYEFVKRYYSKEYIAEDILSKILKHCS